MPTDVAACEKAPFAYYGGKTGIAGRIVQMMPPHRNYIEPFAGSLAVLFAKTPVTNEIVNDIDGAITTFFRVLRDTPDALERVCRLTPYARDEYAAAAVPADTDLEVARRFWVRVNQSFAKTAGATTGWSVTTARTQSAPASVQGRIDRFHACAQRLARVAIENCEAADLVRRLADRDTVVYCDPPYLSSTRRTCAHDYRHDLGSVEAHENLADALHATDATVLLSGYRSDLYDRLYRDWLRVDISVHVNSAKSVARGRRRTTECVWSNRPIHSQQELWEDTDAMREALAVLRGEDQP